MVEEAYNKHIGTSRGNGTLVGNWLEERDLRLFTGEGRLDHILLEEASTSILRNCLFC